MRDLDALLSPPPPALTSATAIAAFCTVGGATTTTRADRKARIPSFRARPETIWLAAIDQASADGVLDHYHLLPGGAIQWAKLTGHTQQSCHQGPLDTAGPSAWFSGRWDFASGQLNCPLQ